MAGEFLAGLGQGTGQSMVQAGIGALTGAYKGRPQWRDISFMNDVANRLTPDEAGRHNTFQDLTYNEDTRRQSDRLLTMGEAETKRIQNMGAELGMSPWELTGSGSSAPTATLQGAPPNQDSSANKFLSAMSPTQTAALQAKTQLAIAAMQSQTAKDVANIQTAGGSLPQEQAKTQISTRTLQMAQENLATAQNQAARNASVLQTVEQLFKMLPEQKITIGPYSVTSKKYFQGLQGIVANQTHAQGTEGTQEDLQAKIGQYLLQIPANDWQIFRKDLDTAIKETFDLAGDTLQEGFQYLKGLTIGQ